MYPSMGVLPSYAGYQETLADLEVTSDKKTALGGSGGSGTEKGFIIVR